MYVMTTQSQKEGGAMLNVVLQDDLKATLKQRRHDEISLSIVRTGYTLGDVESLEPHCYLEAPQNVNNYDTYLVDGVKVYVDKNIEAYDGTIELFEDRFLGLRRCHVFGVKLDN